MENAKWHSGVVETISSGLYQPTSVSDVLAGNWTAGAGVLSAVNVLSQSGFLLLFYIGFKR